MKHERAVTPYNRASSSQGIERVHAGRAVMIARVVGEDIPVGFVVIQDEGLLCRKGLGARPAGFGFSLQAFGRELFTEQPPGFHALCLVDRANGLLFTGDTFYLAPLYTHLDGSDFAAYHETARELAALAPSIERVFPGHNVTAIDPAYLAALRDAGVVLDRRQGQWIYYRLNPDLPEWVREVLAATAGGVSIRPPFDRDLRMLAGMPSRPEKACCS